MEPAHFVNETKQRLGTEILKTVRIRIMKRKFAISRIHHHSFKSAWSRSRLQMYTPIFSLYSNSWRKGHFHVRLKIEIKGEKTQRLQDLRHIPYFPSAEVSEVYIMPLT